MSKEGREANPDILTIQPAGEEASYTVHVCQSFTQGLKEENKTFEPTPKDETYLEVHWKNKTDSTVRSKWIIEFGDHELKKSTILKKLAENLLEKLRESVIETFHRQFKGSLESVRLEENLVFGFMHDDEHSENNMLEKGNLHEVLTKLFTPMKIKKISHSLDKRKQNTKDQKSVDDASEKTSEIRSLGKVPIKETVEDVSDKRKSSAFVVKSQSSTAAEKSRKMGEIVESGDGTHRDAIIAKNYNKAEGLLQNLHVCGSKKDGHPKRTERLIGKVAFALEQEDPKPDKARGLDTVLCIDASDSIGDKGLFNLKEKVKDLIQGIEDAAIDEGLEENVAIVIMGNNSRVLKQLTNDYGVLRKILDSINAGGRSPMMEALLLCIAAIKEKGGIVETKDHRILPRIIFFTDGRCTSDDILKGADTVVPDPKSKTEIIRLVTSIWGSERNIAPLTWVPVGNPDKKFLDSLAKIGFGKVVDMEEIDTLSKHYRIQMMIANVYFVVMTSNNLSIDDVTTALAGELDEDYHSLIVEAVRKKIDFVDVPDPDVQPCDYSNVYEVSDTLALVRGRDWRDEYGDQDLSGPGTVVNHAYVKGWLWVHWDLTKSNCRYRYGFEGMHDVEKKEVRRQLEEDEYIEIGIQVERGPDWPRGKEIDGGAGKKGVVIRKNSEAMVKVKWLATKVIEEHKYGCNGMFEVAVSDVQDICEPEASTVKDTTSVTLKEECSSDTPSHGVWKWKNLQDRWQPFEEIVREKIEREYRRQNRTCLVTMNEFGSVRIDFHNMTAKSTIGGHSFEVSNLENPSHKAYR